MYQIKSILVENQGELKQVNSRERKEFWKTLSNMHGVTPENISDLLAVRKIPHTLCRFRPVTESTLTQLQENKLYFSTADWYDDPFDTYLYINYPLLRKMLQEFNNMLNDPHRLESFIKTVSSMGIPVREILTISMTSSPPPNIQQFENRIKQMRDVIQKNLYSICFCENPLNETLWMKYGDNHRGFVLLYDFHDTSTYLCGYEEKCKQCGIHKYPPNMYPVCYSNRRYDATRYALFLLLNDSLNSIRVPLPQELYNAMQQSMVWEIERISLIKKFQHHYDEEWRMILPTPYSSRPSIKLKPKKVVIGLRTPEYQKLLILAAAKVAGVSQIYSIQISKKDRLELVPVS